MFTFFIFWLKKWNDYKIIFIDPKWYQNRNWDYKVNWYKNIFEDSGNIKEYKHNWLNIQVELCLYNPDLPDNIGDNWKYWKTSVRDIF